MEVKHVRKGFIDILEKACDLFPVSNKNMGAWIRAYHFNAPMYMMVFCVLGPQWLATICIVNMILTLIMFIALNGCWLTLLEKRICGDDINIVDAWIEFFGKDITHKNRMTFTYIIAASCLVIMLTAYWWRFMKQDENSDSSDSSDNRPPFNKNN